MFCRPRVCPDPVRPAPSTLSIVVQPGHKVSRPASSPLAGRPPSHNHDRESLGRIDTVLTTTPGQISAQSLLEGCDLHHHLARLPIE